MILELVMLNFKMTSAIVNDAGVKILTYARAGAGKTVLAATAPKPILISAESGTLSLTRNNLEKLFGKNNPSITYDIPVLEIKSITDLIAAYNWVNQNKNKGDFQTVCLDSITEIAEVLLANLKSGVKDPRQAYGELLERMMQIIRDFRDLKGIHVYMSSKMERFKDEATGALLYGPSMPGAKLGQQLPYLFDEVFPLIISTDAQGGQYRALQTQPTFQYDAKDRSGVLAPLEYPNLTSIINKIKGQ